MPECGISGWAKLLTVEPCSVIEDKDGHVVTGTFKHYVANVLDIWIEDEPEPISTTPNHPFWSEEAGTFVRADQLVVGSTLRRIDQTPAMVKRIEARSSQGRVVYNIEVHSQHTYFVGQNGVLVHNSAINPCAAMPSSAKPGDIMTYREWEKVEVKIDVNGNLLEGHHPVSQKVLKKNGLDPKDAPIVVITELLQTYMIIRKTRHLMGVKRGEFHHVHMITTASDRGVRASGCDRLRPETRAVRP